MIYAPKQRICLNCFNTYQPTSYRQKYCGSKRLKTGCTALLHSKGKTIPSPVKVRLKVLGKCLRCSVTFEVVPGKKYCGSRKLKTGCSWAIVRERSFARWKKKPLIVREAVRILEAPEYTPQLIEIPVTIYRSEPKPKTKKYYPSFHVDEGKNGSTYYSILLKTFGKEKADREWNKQRNYQPSFGII